MSKRLSDVQHPFPLFLAATMFGWFVILTLELTFRCSSAQFLQSLTAGEVFIAFSGLFAVLTVPVLLWAAAFAGIHRVLIEARPGTSLWVQVNWSVLWAPFSYLVFVYFSKWLYSVSGVKLVGDDLLSLLLAAGLTLEIILFVLATADNTVNFLQRRKRTILVCWLLCATPFLLDLGRYILSSPPAARGEEHASSVGRQHKGYVIVVITAESLNAERLGVYGYPTDNTPFLTELAQTSYVFSRAYSSASKTRSSVACILTGKSAMTHGAIDEIGVLKSQHRYEHLPSILIQHRYITGDFCHTYKYTHTHWSDPRKYGLCDGFDYVGNASVREHSASHRLEKVLVGQAMTPRWLRAMLEDATGDVGWALSSLLGHLSPALPSRSGYEGLFHLLDAKYDRLFLHIHDLETHPLKPDSQWNTTGPLFASHIVKFSVYAKDDASLLDDSILSFDSNVGTVVNRLKQLNLWDRTLLIVVGDHRLRWASDGGTIPLIIHFPGQKEGRLIDTPVAHVDLAPTILTCLSLPVPSWMEGIPLQRFLEDPVSRRGTPIFSFGSRTSTSGVYGTVVKDNYVLVRAMNGTSNVLYDVSAGKKAEVLYGRTEVRKEMKELWWKHFRDYFSLMGSK